MMITSNPTVTTLNPSVIATGGVLNGEAASFAANNNLEVYYLYSVGTSLPANPVQSPKQLVTSVTSGTIIPAFTVTGTCSSYTYKVSPKQ